MRSLFVILLAVALCEAKPNPKIAVASLSPDSYILGGVDAEPGEFRWQLSQQRQGVLGNWLHSCGASLLSANYALTAAYCLDGADVTVIRVVAGQYDRSQDADAVISNAASYRLHESYGTGAGTNPNDIAIITLATPIEANGGTIQYAVLPPNNDNQFVGLDFVLTGWGRNGGSNLLPSILQKATIPAISTADCNELMSSVSGASVTDNMVCFYNAQAGACYGDRGGPANIDIDGIWIVGGVASWAVQGDTATCSPSYPSVYTRTGAYLDWIAAATP